MLTKKTSENLVDIVVEKSSKLPIGFLVGAAIGGGLYWYATKQSNAQKIKVAKKIGKIVAPYVIVTLLDKLGDIYDNK